jgi:hypothetical protein
MNENYKTIACAPWIIRNDNDLSDLSVRERCLAQAYEYILSDQWGKGRPDPLQKEMRRKGRTI